MTVMQVGSFSTMAALMTCTTSLGLFAISTLLVDQMLDYFKKFGIHKEKKYTITDKVSGKQLAASDIKAKLQRVKRTGSGTDDAGTMLELGERGSGSVYQAETS